MNLEYAAYLLNENHILNEDANGTAVEKAKKWLKKNYHLTEFGKEAEEDVLDAEGMPVRMIDRITHEQRNQRNIDDIIETARTFFGHWLGNQLRIPRRVTREDGTEGPNNAAGIYKYLPGAIRVAISDCGWFTAHPNTKMLENLRYIYAYAWDEWQTGLTEGRPGPQRGQPYAGKLTADFNGKSYQQLMNEFGSKIPEIKAKIEQNGGPGTEYDAEEETPAAEEAPAPVDQSPYHIELIENFRQSNQWCDYTNPTADQAHNHFAGARWCLAEMSDQWGYYQRNFDKQPTVYFCWKAASKEALMEMNNHVADYDVPEARERDRDGNRNDKMNPFNEYGLSLICVIVEPGDNPGEVRFLQATSRYNHCNGHGEQRFHGNVSTYYGDNLCRDGGKRQICEILGMSAEEFDRRLKPVAGAGNSSIDHTNIMAATDLEQVLHLAGDYDRYENVGLYRIRHEREYNFYDMYTNKFISNVWFREAGYFSNNGYCIVKVNRNKYNLINSNGDYMIDVDVDRLDYDPDVNENYAKIGINKNGNMYYNIIRVDNGRPLLRRLYKDVKLAQTFGKTISVMDDDNRWKLIDIKGKVVSTLPEDMEINRDTSKLMFLRSRSRSNYYKIISKKNNREIAKLTGSLSRINTYGDGCIMIKKEDNKYNLYTENGPVFDTWVNYISSHSSYDKLIYSYKQGRTYGFVTSAGRKIETGSRELDEISGGVIKCGEKFYNFKGDELNLPRTTYLADATYNITVMKEGDYYKFYNVLTSDFVDLGGANITGYTSRDNGYFIKTADSKTNFIDGKTGEVVSDTFFDNYQINPIGQNCYLLDKGGNKLNIFNADFGEELFDMDFTELRTRFSENGLAFIRCNNSNFVINTQGDVSHSVELIAENIRIYHGAENFLFETGKSRPVNKFFMKAAYFLD